MDAVAETGETSVDIAPATAAERISSLDFIRGIAVMGILAANIVAFGQISAAYMYPEAFMVPVADPGGWLWIAQFVLIDGKMRALFTILFGAGLYLFMERAWSRGATRWLQFRRLSILMLFGLAHYYFIWFGDILFYYALFGMILLPVLAKSAKWQFRAGLIGYAVGILAYAAMMVPLHFIAETPFGESVAMAETREGLEKGMEKALADGAAEAKLHQTGDYAGLVAHRIGEHGIEPLFNSLLFALEGIPLMLIGMALYRMGFFSGGVDRSKLLKWGWIGVGAGASMNLLVGLWAKSTGFAYYATLGAFIGMTPLPRLMMAIGLAALMVAYSPSLTGWLAQRVRAAGRAAFTNYLGTSILMMFVFQGWALGLFGALNRPQLYLVTAIACCVMLAWSKPWLDRYRYGPLEWLWRCLTYGKKFPLKR